MKFDWIGESFVGELWLNMPGVSLGTCLEVLSERWPFVEVDPLIHSGLFALEFEAMGSSLLQLSLHEVPEFVGDSHRIAAIADAILTPFRLKPIGLRQLVALTWQDPKLVDGFFLPATANQSVDEDGDIVMPVMFSGRLRTSVVRPDQDRSDFSRWRRDDPTLRIVGIKKEFTDSLPIVPQGPFDKEGRAKE